MKTQAQANIELTKLCSLIEDIPVAMLTSFDADGTLASRPMAVLEMDGNGALWFFTDLRSAKVQELRNLNLSFSDVAHGSYVSLSGHGEINTDRARIGRMWTPLAKPWFPAGPESAHLGLLKFMPEAAEYWDAPHNSMVRMFAMAASVVAGKPVGMGEHDNLTHLTRPAAAAAASTSARV